MAELKSMNFTSLVSKKTRRARVRILQNFGRAEKTTDELFDVYHQNFDKQQNSSLKLQKELKNYTNCLKALHDATTSLNLCLLELHEKEWPKHDEFENDTIELDHSIEDLEEKLKESVMIPIDQYLSQFADIKDKISKRGRKLVDYDSNRHNFEALQTNCTNSRTGEDNKLMKSKEQLDESKRVYDMINTELHDELPALYDSRIPFITSVLQRLFSANIAYHSSSLAIYKSFTDIIEQLAIKAQKGLYNISHGRSHNSSLESPMQSTTRPINEISYAAIDKKRQSSVSIPTNNDNRKQSTVNNELTHSHLESPVRHVQPTCLNSNISNGRVVSSPDDKLTQTKNNEQISAIKTSQSHTTPMMSSTKDHVTSNSSIMSKDVPDSDGGDKIVVSNTQNRQQQQAENSSEAIGTISQQMPVVSTTNDQPSRILYKVKASYKYIAEDEDELSFDAGEIIYVVEYDDPQEQEDGWLMGIKEQGRQKGLFPANFTRAL